MEINRLLANATADWARITSLAVQGTPDMFLEEQSTEKNIYRIDSQLIEPANSGK